MTTPYNDTTVYVDTYGDTYDAGYDADYGSTGPLFTISAPTDGSTIPVGGPTPPVPPDTSDLPPIDSPPNQVLPGTLGGVVETVKRGVVTALRTALTGTSLSLPDNAQVHVDLEYPVQEQNYPGVWVQFSLKRLQISGLGHQWVEPNGDIVQQWAYDGEVTLTLVALTSIERDRIADVLISYFAFSRVNGAAVPLSPLYQVLAANPYVSMTVNSDQLIPGGQSVTVGVPWSPDLLAYEDNYKFGLHGEFQSVYSPTTQAVRLSAVQVAADVQAATYQTGEWI